MVLYSKNQVFLIQTSIEWNRHDIMRNDFFTHKLK